MQQLTDYSDCPRCVIYMPDNQSKEKIQLLETLGAEVRPVPVVPWSDPANYNHLAREYAESLDNAVWTNQFDNVANRRAHMEVIPFLITCVCVYLSI